jgi:ABC-type branched-subunit amino acid transport system ATPase component
MTQARGLTRRYGGTLAVDRLTIRVEPGKITGFVGPNGAGETARHSTISCELASAGAADLHHQAQREVPACAARRVRLSPARPNLTDARCQALFASTLQRSDAPGADVVAEAITATMRQFGAEGCTSRMAQEFGDHPEAAAARMRWVRSLLS